MFGERLDIVCDPQQFSVYSNIERFRVNPACRYGSIINIEPCTWETMPPCMIQPGNSHHNFLWLLCCSLSAMLGSFLNVNFVKLKLTTGNPRGGDIQGVYMKLSFTTSGIEILEI